MNLQFSIQTFGYIIAELELKEKKIKIGHSSSYGDKFQELLNELFLIYNSSKHGDESFFPYIFDVKWYDDRVNYSWSVSAATLNSEIEVEIFELSPVEKTHKIQLLKHNFAFEDLFTAVYTSLEKMLKEFGFIGYKSNWVVGNFPMYEYLKLKSDKYGLELKKEEVTEDDDWKEKMSIKNELIVILNDFQ